MAKKYIEAKEFWNRLISRSENDWVGFDTIDEVLSGMPDIDYEIINDAHNEGYDVGYWAGRRDYEPRWIPCSERMPKDRQRVLVQFINGFITLIDFHAEGLTNHIEAWMPLPEPYKGGEEE